MRSRQIASGLELIEEIAGEGPVAASGDEVVYQLRLYLNRGDEVRFNEAQLAQALPEGGVEWVDGRPLINHRLLLGRRRAIAGVEKTLTGMKVGGYRRVRVSPHLAYAENGIPGLVPADAVLTMEIWLRGIGTSAT